MRFFHVLGNGKEAFLVCWVSANRTLVNQLGLEIFHSLRKRPFSPLLVDYGLSVPRTFTRGCGSCSIPWSGKNSEREKVGKHVGVILPPGIGGFAANIALIISGRVPVNLNFTLGSEMNRYLLTSTEISTILTASKMVQKLP